MSRTLIALLVVTNAATGYELYRYNQRYEAAISNQTTSREREIGGEACVKWLSEKVVDTKINLAVGRSWKKHGQLVFEVMPASDEDWKLARETMTDDEFPSVLCTYDKQSGVMYAVQGAERERWMFYE